MAKDDVLKDGGKSFEFLDDTNYSNDTTRPLICQNCFHVWETNKHPNSITKCPSCDAESNATRRIIFFWDKENEEILLS